MAIFEAVAGEMLGRVVRLQVQTRPLKSGRPRGYDPSGLHAVTHLDVSPSGVVGTTADGQRLLDCHHVEHPQTRDGKGRRGVSLLALGDYRWLRARFGAHLVDGVAGESMLIDRATPLAGLDLSAGLLVAGQPPFRLAAVRPATPCVEFSRFCLGRSLDAGEEVDDTVRGALAELIGHRGFIAVAGEQGRVAVGDLVCLAGELRDGPSARHGVSGGLGGELRGGLRGGLRHGLHDGPSGRLRDGLPGELREEIR